MADPVDNEVLDFTEPGPEITRTIPEGIVASFEGSCVLCERTILAGESWVVRWADGHAHVNCAEIELAADEQLDPEENP